MSGRHFMRRSPKQNQLAVGSPPCMLVRLDSASEAYAVELRAKAEVRKHYR